MLLLTFSAQSHPSGADPAVQVHLLRFEDGVVHEGKLSLHFQPSIETNMATAALLYICVCVVDVSDHRVPCFCMYLSRSTGPKFWVGGLKGVGSVTDRGYVFAPLIFFGALLVLGSVRSFFISYDPQIFPTRAIKIWFYTCLCIVFCFMLSILAFFLSLAFVSDENAHKHRVGSLRAVHVLIGSVIILWILVCMIGVSINHPTLLPLPLCCGTNLARSGLTTYGRLCQFRLCSKEGEVNQRRHVGPAILVNISGGCILTLLAIQISLIVSKLQGAAQYTWGTALTPIWILDAIAICATLIILAAVFKDEELHTPAVTSLYAVVGGWLSLFSSFFFSEILFVTYMDQDVNGANNLTPYNVIAPFIVIWGFFFIISIFEFVRYLSWPMQACCPDVRSAALEDVVH